MAGKVSFVDAAEVGLEQKRLFCNEVSVDRKVRGIHFCCVLGNVWYFFTVFYLLTCYASLSFLKIASYTYAHVLYGSSMFVVCGDFFFPFSITH